VVELADDFRDAEQEGQPAAAELGDAAKSGTAGEDVLDVAHDDLAVTEDAVNNQAKLAELTADEHDAEDILVFNGRFG
jgi:hypothetical protein